MEDIVYISMSFSLYWVVMGDFKNIISIEEKMGRVSHPTWLMRGFREATVFSGLGDSSLRESNSIGRILGVPRVGWQSLVEVK